tara:strand:+ start:917 stop:1222 length:306 start_codon:yes stop_codon:yes gene_type:complete
MKPEAQRIAIASACGWTRNGSSGNEEHPWVKPVNGVAKSLPNYLSDLNAMHEAEKVLEQKNLITPYLQRLGMGRRPTWQVCRATAPQRAEAFLCTLNLYTS